MIYEIMGSPAKYSADIWSEEDKIIFLIKKKKIFPNILRVKSLEGQEEGKKLNYY